MKYLRPYLFALLSVSSALAHAGGDPVAGELKAEPCAACHAADGNSIMPDWPKLAGQSAKYLAQQLHAFKAGDRDNVLMTPMATGLNEQDIADLSAYFASQKVTIGKADEELVETGKWLYRGGDIERGIPACMACHGPTGTGNPAAAYPAVQGQHAAYTVTQLKMFRTGERQTDANNVMRDIADKLKDHDIEAVASYIAGLH